MLELAMDPADLPRFRRMLAQKGAQPSRPVPVRRVWYDGPEDDLARARLALSESEGIWRLERTAADAEDTDRAGQSPAILGEATEPSELGEKLPERLQPLAVLEGRERRLVLKQSPSVIVGILEGSLRSLTERRPIARLSLDGPAPALAALAEQWAEKYALAAPSAPLAVESWALARGLPVPPQRSGAPVLDEGQSVEEAFLRILGHYTAAVLSWTQTVLEAATEVRQESFDPEPVHQMRVALRRLRSAFSVFKPIIACAAVTRTKSQLKKFANILGHARDWDVFLDGLGQSVRESFPSHPAIAGLLQTARDRRAEQYDALAHYLREEAFRRLGVALAVLPLARPWRVEAPETRLPVLEAPVVDFARRVLHRKLRRLIADGNNFALLPAPQLHRLRLDTKRLRYACEFFAPLFPNRHAKRFIRRLSEVQDALGKVNDGAVVKRLMEELAGWESDHAERAFARGVVSGYAAASARGARKDAGKTWERLQELDPFWE
jgi:triphosphatase